MLKTFLAILVFLSVSFSASAHSVTLNWTDPTPGVTYNVYRGTASGLESKTPINSTAINALSFKDTTVQSGVQYFYYVKAVLNGVSSSPSNEVVVPVPVTPVTGLKINSSH